MRRRPLKQKEADETGSKKEEMVEVWKRVEELKKERETEWATAREVEASGRRIGKGRR